MYADKKTRDRLRYKCSRLGIPKNFWFKMGKNTTQNVSEIENLIDEQILAFYWGTNGEVVSNGKNRVK